MAKSRRETNFPFIWRALLILFGLRSTIPLVFAGKYQREFYRRYGKSKSKSTKRKSYKTPKSHYSRYFYHPPVTDDSELRCFNDAEEATRLGTKILQAFWHDILDTDCIPKKIARVYDIYFRDDLLVQDRSGNVISDDLEQYKEDSIGDGTEPGTITYICEYQKLRFKATEDAFIEPGVFDEFVWIGNQIICDDALGEVQQQRQFFIELFGSSGSLSYHRKRQKYSKAKSGSWFYGYNGNGYTKACHRPQIYTIVILD